MHIKTHTLDMRSFKYGFQNAVGDCFALLMLLAAQGEVGGGVCSLGRKYGIHIERRPCHHPRGTAGTGGSSQQHGIVGAVFVVAVVAIVVVVVICCHPRSTKGPPQRQAGREDGGAHP